MQMTNKEVVLVLKHANLKKADGTPEELLLSRGLVFGAYRSQAHKCTHVIASGGAMVAVMETPEEIWQLLKQGEEHGTTNGTKHDEHDTTA